MACVVGRGLSELREHCKLIGPLPEHNVALIGVRDLDPAEEQLLLESSVALVRGPELARDPAALDRALQGLGSLPRPTRDCKHAHVEAQKLKGVTRGRS